MSVRVDRARVLAYRVVVQGLDRPGVRPAVLDLGVQDTPSGSARLAFVNRMPTVAAARALVSSLTSTSAPPSGERLSLAWTLRGAPHVHPAAGLPPLAAALWPLSAADALSRVAWQRARLKASGMGAVEALTEVTAAMHAVVTTAMTKSDASAAVSDAVPTSLTAWCEPCGSRHVYESLFRLAALPAGVRLEPDSTPLRLAPIDGWSAIPDAAAGTGELVGAYLRFLGPAGPGDAASFLGSTRTELRRVWPDDVAEVEVDGRGTWLPESDVATLLDAPPPRLVRLLPPSDPYLQARDRDLLLPDRASQKAVWTALGQPGALLIDGEIAGIWRPRTSGRTLRLTITPFDTLTARTRKALVDEVNLVAEVRGATKVDVVINND